MGRRWQRRVALGVVMSVAACGEAKSSVSGTVDVDAEVEASSYWTLEIRAVAYDADQPDARARPLEDSPFHESVARSDRRCGSVLCK